MAAKKNSDDLFRLIHALSVEEKGYFKKFAKRHTSGGTSYLKLFDAINAQKVFEEKLLKKKFKDYAVWKSYLIDMIFKSLLIFKTDFETRDEIMRQMLYFKIMEDKGLTARARSHAGKLLQQAREAEAFWLEEELLRWNHSVSKYSWKPEELYDKNMQLFSDIEKVKARQANKDSYIKEHFKNHLIERAKLYGNRSVAELEGQLDLDFLKNDKGALSAGNERIRLGTLYSYYFTRHDFENAYLIAKKLFADEKKRFAQNHPLTSFYYYILFLRQLIISCIGSDRYEEAERLLNRDWKSPSTGEQEKAENRIHFVYHKSQLLWFTGRHLEGERFMNDHTSALLDEKYLKRFAYYIIDILKTKILFEFSNRHFQKATISVHLFQDMAGKGNYQKYFRECELIKVIMQAEMGNYDVLTNLIQNILRKEKQLSLSANEKKFLNILKKLNGFNGLKIHQELSELARNAQQPIVLLDNLDLKDWTLCKLQGRPYSEWMKEQKEISGK